MGGERSALQRRAKLSSVRARLTAASLPLLPRPSEPPTCPVQQMLVTGCLLPTVR